MKKLNITIITLLIGFTTFAQDLTCNDFKKGIFYIPLKSTIDTLFVANPKGDITEKIQVPIEKGLKKYVVDRWSNTQIEWENKLNTGVPIYEKIKWIGKCKYILSKDESKTKLTEDDLFVIENGGLIVEKIEIKGKCMKYKSTLKLKVGGEMYLIGEICKE